MRDRTNRPWRRRFRGHIEATAWPGVTIFLAYAGYGLGMVAQPGRFLLTPAYGTLTQVLNIQLWGAIYLTVAALFAVYATVVTSRLFGIITHMTGLTVTSTWWLAFVIRWITDEATTVVNIVSWGVLLLIISWSASLIPVTSRLATPGDES